MTSVRFVAHDANTATAVTQGVYQTHGQICTLVVPKLASIPDLFTAAEATRLLDQGAVRLDWAGYDSAHSRLIVTAIGAHQLEEVLKASARLTERQIPHSVIVMLEPRRFCKPHSAGERDHVVPAGLRTALYPEATPLRLFVTHTRSKPLAGILQPLHTGHGKTAALGFVGQGGPSPSPSCSSSIAASGRTSWTRRPNYSTCGSRGC